MANIVKLQQEHKEWLDDNFPQQQSWQPLLGMVEELGEAAHAYLKLSQGIRTATLDDLKDALGDVFIYMMSFCNTMGWSLADIVEEAWSEVSQRNWIDNPKDGGNG